MYLTQLENDESIDMIESVSGDLWDPIEEYGQEGQSSKTETQEETIISVSQRLNGIFFVKNWTFYIFPWNVSEKASYDDEQHLPEELQETRGKIPETDWDSAFRSTLSSPKSSKREFC